VYDLEERINFAVFPALQGGPHNNTIAAISVALKEASAPDFLEYQRQVKRNSARLAKEMLDRKYTLVSGGTDNHLFLLDLRPLGIDGARVDSLLERCNITLNKNAVPGDTKPLVPGGVRIGSPAMTTRGMKEGDFAKIGDLVHRGIQLAIKLNSEGDNSKKLKSFQSAVLQEGGEIRSLRDEVISFVSSFPMP